MSDAPQVTTPPTGMLASFRVPGFARLWIGAVLFSMGQWMERVAIGWFVFDVTDSILLTAVSFSVRSAPAIILGPIAGAVSDRYPRGRVLAMTAAALGSVVLLVAAMVFLDRVTLVALFLLIAMSGSGMSFSTTALQALAGDLVGREGIANAISLTSVGQRAVGVAGALSGGALVGLIGPGPTFLLATLPFAAAAFTYAGIPIPVRAAGSRSASFFSDVVDGLRTVLRIPVVALLLAMMVLVEIVGFSYQSMLPVVAERVLNVGPSGLGGLFAASAVGSMLGTMLLTAISGRRRQGMVLVAACGAFGVALISLGVSTFYAVSIVAALCVGAAAAMVDALEWILLQKSVPDELRGRVLGAWAVAIGFGWVGPVILGGIAEVAGPQAALVAAGVVLVAAAGVIGAGARSLRAL
ncbi:MAG: MFS transporter [Chloroflexi bacterium]|nr:MFS transporter [Chloroflexota bacterium]MDA1241123.1 MFS transporter [Chloroflexota bacterium]